MRIKHNQQALGPVNQKKERTQINRLRSEQGNITTCTKENNNITKKYFKNTLYSIKLGNLKEMSKFLDLAKPPELNQEGVNNLN